MKRSSIAVGVTLFLLAGTSPALGRAAEDYHPMGANIPATATPMGNSERDFQFAIVGDRIGGHRSGVFKDAISKIDQEWSAQPALALAPALAPISITDQAVLFDDVHVLFAASTGDYQIVWQAQAIGQVTVYAGPSPSQIDRTRPLASGRSGEALTISGLNPDQRWFFALVPDQGRELIVAEQSLRLSAAPNFRDAGGHRTADGRWVKMGLIYRSDQLDRMGSADLALLETLGFGTVADLRTQSERDREPDRIPQGADHIILDVAADAAGSLGGDMRQAMAKIAAGEGAQMLIEANRDFVIQPSARAAYAALITKIALGDAPLVYHCTAGKDRTGWASAIILSLVGVPRETVMQDYLASNIYLAQKNQAILADARKSGAAIDARHLEAVLTVRSEFIDAAFEEVDVRYGSFEDYARDGLGLDADIVDRLRARLLDGLPDAGRT